MLGATLGDSINTFLMGRKVPTTQSASPTGFQTLKKCIEAPARPRAPWMCPGIGEVEGLAGGRS